MNEHVFDLLLRRASTTNSRRGIVGALASLTLGGMTGTLFGALDAEAKHHHRKRKRRKNKRKKDNAATSPPPPPLTCLADCTGKACGDDGCGGTCGSCGTDARCVAGSCLCADGLKPCQGACIPLGKCCTSEECRNGDQCITGACTPPPTCTGWSGTCVDDGDCCSDFCQGNGTCACSEAGEACHDAGDCCPVPALQDCVNFVCVPI